MPRRSDRPGLKRGRHNLPYWIARQVVRDPMRFPDACIPLPPDADDAHLGELCRNHTARLLAWIAQQQACAEAGLPPLPRYDGTVYSACQLYQKHPRSRFHTVKHNTRNTYVSSLKVIEATVGARLIRKLNVLDVQHWYDEWRKPAAIADPDAPAIARQVHKGVHGIVRHKGVEERPSSRAMDGRKRPGALDGLCRERPVGPERIDRAHDAVSMFRTVLHFCAALRHDDCKRLAAELREARSLVHFEKGGGREEELTYRHATAFVAKALELGNRGVMPAGRARSMAIGVAAQFDLMLRQRDIIGEYPPTQAEAQTAAKRARIEPLRIGDEWWVGAFTWEKIPGWRWRMRTSKSRYRAGAEFFLDRYSLLFPLLEAVPHGERAGAIVKGEGGLPVRQSSYGKWFRQIARAAGIPDEVWNMDARAGGATEADDAGASLDAINAALTHSPKDTNITLRYIRRRSKKAAAVADARAAKRAADEEGA